jgi:hypothetical protein
MKDGGWVRTGKGWNGGHDTACLFSGKRRRQKADMDDFIWWDENRTRTELSSEGF